MNKLQPSLRADEIRRQMKVKQQTRSIAYDKVVNFVHCHISRKASIGVTSMMYEIPFVVMGLPAINASDCFLHVVRALQTDGYCVRYVPPRSIYVSWNFAEKGMGMTHNEILNAAADISCPFKPHNRQVSNQVSREPGLSPSRVTNRVDEAQIKQFVPDIHRNEANTGALSMALPVLREDVYVSPVQTHMFPWESFETGTRVGLLPPPQMTVTEIKTIPHEYYKEPNPQPCIRREVEYHKPVEPRVRVDSIGPGGGLILNL